MDIARVAPFPLSVPIEGLESSTDYVFCIMNTYGEDLSEIPVTSDVDGVGITPLPDYYSRYDNDYRLEVYEDTGTLDDDGNIVRGDLVYIDTLSIYRPYLIIDQSSMSPEEIAESMEYEAVVRAMIDAHSSGFTFKRSTIELSGNGSDYLPVMERITKIIRVYENNTLLFDAENTDPEWANIKNYILSPDKTAITETVSAGYNRYQSRPAEIPTGWSDSFSSSEYQYDPPTKVFPDMGWSMFPSGWDYTIVMEHGYPVIPQDIQKAAKILYSDLKCGNIQYRNSYIKEYESSNQFKIKIDERSMSGTGNILVDNILSKYPKSITKMGLV